ncbi:hypothetical protein SE17_18415 [Kouleothrix aurantiaca]|uniref:Poly(3-hydroxyalkanoate) polymerase subunit PhaE n=1 Tax=Kouleothrix aurantiaca TaxID=186479 RepID=A0A0P9HBV6_9CHLR|nr:hypothetical protein SE17_18415 [Kouleothrix aurantiaca]
MSASNDDRSLFDPTGMLRSMQAASIAAMTQMLNSEEYARAAGAMFDAYLENSAPFRAMMEQMLRQFVQSDAYAEATRAVLENYLASAAPFQAAFAELMRSDAYAEATRAMLDSYMLSSAPFREAVAAAMRQAFAGAARGELPSFAGWLDPTGMMKTMRDATMSAWTSQPPAEFFQQTIEQSMTQALIQLNMPTRTDVTSIGDRLSLLEQRIGEIEARLAARGEAPKPAASTAKLAQAKQPARSRTRKTGQS